MQGMTDIGAIFTSKKLKSKKGTEYFSGKSEGSKTFDLMGFPRVSANGVEYISIVRVERDEEAPKTEKKAEGGSDDGYWDNLTGEVDG